jgi:1-aminocyclopropane-1-carboxylate deaminase
MQILNDFIKCTPVSFQTNSGNQIDFTLARLDEIHPVISGNKYFKLKYNLQAALQEQKEGILTMGGAFSNHLCATAFACKQAGIKSAAIVRGEVLQPYNPTLLFCKEQGMELIAAARNQYNENSNHVQQLIQQYSHYYFVPEGGNNANGIKGCAEIQSNIANATEYTHLICCTGTGATFKGLVQSALQHQTIIGIPVLKIKQEERDAFLNNYTETISAATKKIFFEFAGKGYAKADAGLFDFMNSFYKRTGIKTDFVYTAKLMNGVIELFEQGYLQKTHHVLVLHTGGLQGNNSLAQGVLSY